MVHKGRQSLSKAGVECVPNNLAVDSAGDAVLQLEVHLGDGIVGEDGGVRDITYTVKIVESVPVAFANRIPSIRACCCRLRS